MGDCAAVIFNLWCESIKLSLESLKLIPVLQHKEHQATDQRVDTPAETTKDKVRKASMRSFTLPTQSASDFLHVGRPAYGSALVGKVRVVM